MLRGIFIILLFYFLGEVASILIKGFIPGSVLGMLLLFVSLTAKVIKPEYVKGVATAITSNMALFFVAPAVGLMTYTALFKQHFWIITVSIVVSTILTMVSVAYTQEFFERRIFPKTPSDNITGDNLPNNGVSNKGADNDR